MTPGHEAPPPSRLARLLPLLEQDPSNIALLSDAAEAALDEGEAQITRDLLDRYRAIAPLPPQEINLAALAALRLGLHEEAAEGLERLVAAGVSDSAVRFNLAWALVFCEQAERALSLIDAEMTARLPQAAALHLQLLHDRGALDAAQEYARHYLALHPGHSGVLAAVSVLAIDVGDLDLARSCALDAGDNADALATLGTLALGDRQPAEALVLFDRALAHHAGVPRAWIGRGLARLVSGDAAEAAADIDRGAGMFGNHLGSWIAAGWAHVVSGDRVAARERFETALALDPTFAEAHGSLAAMAALDGDLETARKSVERARRLDRNAASASLAAMMLAAGSGDAEGARTILDRALAVPMGPGGETLAQALARMGLGR